MSETDPAGAQLARLLTDLANDPAAPPSTVDAQSVIRAARSAAVADEGQPSVAAPAADDPAPAEVLQFRPSRRRKMLVALLAAASLAGVAALVIPLSLSGGSSTSTSADAERAVAESAADEPAAGGAAAPLPDKAAAPDLGISSAAAADAATGSAPAAGSAPREDAQADGFAAAADCWPALTEPVARALVAALPAGAYAEPQPLANSCPAEPSSPVGGALLPGSVPPADATATVAAAESAGTALVVRISTADPGACVKVDLVTGPRCAPQLDGTYLATDGPGSPTVYVYGGGHEVAIGGLPDSGATSGLSIEQLTAAAQAVLGALG
jgi:hypothetical protein